MRARSLLLLLAALTAAVLFSLGAGPAGISDWALITGLRLPRTLAALIVGTGLGLAGALFQGALKNPLSDPYILGTSAGATAAAVLCFMSGIERGSPLFYLLVFCGAFGATFLSYWLARLAGRLSDASLVLAGVAVSAFLSAVVMLALSVAKERSFSLFSFVLGGLYPASGTELGVSAAIVAACAALAMLRWRALDAMGLGEEKAYHLGADPARERLIFFALACASTSAAVSLGGTIGFVGLMTPHIMRLFCGPSARWLLPAPTPPGAFFFLRPRSPPGSSWPWPARPSLCGCCGGAAAKGPRYCCPRPRAVRLRDPRLPPGKPEAPGPGPKARCSPRTACVSPMARPRS